MQRAKERNCHYYFYPRPPDGGRRINQLKNYCLLINFYPRPPGGGRPRRGRGEREQTRISIHALRVEGDLFLGRCLIKFLISIHALRVEGDAWLYAVQGLASISIHALRVEGD